MNEYRIGQGWKAFRRRLPWLGAAASGLLMSASFAPLAWADAAWVALVPMVLGLYFLDRRQALKAGFLAGALCWLTSIWWLTRVTLAGWFLLSLYCALYWIPFAVLVQGWFRRFGAARFLPNVGLMLGAAAVWTGFEWVRGNLLTGFPWNPFGVSQSSNLSLIAHAAWGGVYAVTAVLVWTNMGIGLTVLRYVNRETRRFRRPHPELFLSLLVVMVGIYTGLNMSREPVVGGQWLRVAMVQPNIPQEQKWSDSTIDLIYERLGDLTGKALDFTEPDLLVWPETALPDDVRLSQPSYDLVYSLASRGTPMLVGSMDTMWGDDGVVRYYNSSFLFDDKGTITGTYDKRHLVLFGEYIPFHEHLLFLSTYAPVPASFTSGTTSTVFRIEKPSVTFSSLICFEDTVAALGRESVRNGARFLINQTNDAWFDPSAASRQHMAHGVFRAVENRVPMVRVANSGVSCAIDHRGRVQDVIADGEGKVRVPGFRVTPVLTPPDRMALTFYTRHGDVFAVAMLLPGLVFLGWMARGGTRTDTGGTD